MDAAQHPHQKQNLPSVNDNDAPSQLADQILDYVFAKVREGAVQPTGLKLYDPRPTDVIVTTFPKAGTTLVQNLLYNLLYRTTFAPHSDIAPLDTFKDISVAVPWLDYHPELGVSLPTTTPRIFKSHSQVKAFATFHDDPAIAPRHIVVIRSPFDFPSSWLDFRLDKLDSIFEVSSRPEVREGIFHAFVRRVVLQDGRDHSSSYGDWFTHTHDWITPLRRNVYILFYEDILADMSTTVRSIARFLELDETLVTDEIVNKVIRACSRDAMVGDTRFQCGVEFVLCSGTGNSVPWKVMPEKRVVDSYKQFSFSETEQVRMSEAMQQVLGYRSYDELKSGVKKAQREKFGL